MFRYLRLFQYLVLLASLTACDSPLESDYEYVINGERGHTLVVFVAGLGGKDTWQSMIKLLRQDAELESVDYLHYYSPKALNFDENVAQLKSLVSRYRVGYDKVVYVGHSLGGMMIKRALIREANLPEAQRVLPDKVITFGTPLETNTFAISVFEKLGARVAWFFLPSLSRDVFNIQHIARINRSWRTATALPAIQNIERVNIFGYQDPTAPIDHETQGDYTHFIPGDHLKIVQPRDAKDCSWVLFRALLMGAAVSELPPCENAR